MGEHMHRSRNLTLPILILLTLVSGATRGADEDFLLPDQAFRISGEAAGRHKVLVSWDIADGYYMYQSKFRFRSETAGIETGNPKPPAAEVKHDDFFGDVAIYRKRVSIPLTLTRSADADNILTLETTSQGCADAGLCYPPHKQKILLELPKLAAIKAPLESPGEAAKIVEKAPATGALSELNQTLGLVARRTSSSSRTKPSVSPPRWPLLIDCSLTG
jgi:thiol:disulfide interchange protein DsbD